MADRQARCPGIQRAGADFDLLAESYLAPKVHLDPDDMHPFAPLRQPARRESAVGECGETGVLEVVEIDRVVDVCEAVELVASSSDAEAVFTRLPVLRCAVVIAHRRGGARTSRLEASARVSMMCPT